MPHDDDDLKALLRRADPSSESAPLDDSRVRRLVAAAERDRADEVVAEHRRSGRVRPRARWWTAGGSLAAVAAAVGGFALVGSLTTAPIQAGLPPVTGIRECSATSVVALRSNEVAVEAEVTRADDETADLRVTQVFKGDPGTELTVPQTNDLDKALAVGRTYLIALDSGTIDECDSGIATDELRTTYEEAYGAPKTAAP